MAYALHVCAYPMIALQGPMSDSVPLDVDIIKQVLAGDKQAFNLLIYKYECRIQHVVGRYLHGSVDAFDVTQDVFLRAYQALPRFKGNSHFYTWLYRIAVNTAKNHCLEVKRRPPSSDIDFSDAEQLLVYPQVYESVDPLQALMSHEMEAYIFQTINALPHKLRIVITLRELEGLSYHSIARKMACPVGTVRSRIFRAREILGASLQQGLQQYSIAQRRAQVR